MPRSAVPVAPDKTRRAIVKLLKSDGGMDAASLAAKLGLTAMGVRQHLYALRDQKLVDYEERPQPVGRPAKVWQLTREANRLFPEAYAELSVALIDGMRDAFGPAGLARILESRRARQEAEYRKRIPSSLPLKQKLRLLVRIRTEEGYMADFTCEKPGSYLIVENHCPICAAAAACQGFCATELDLFRTVLGPDVSIERVDHIVSGDRRCAYRVESHPPTRSALSPGR